MSANGYLTQDEIAPIVGGGYLRKGAAAGWNALAYYVFDKEGWWIHTNGPDSSYRPFDRQVAMKNYWCGLGNCANAATPGTSNHGWGVAVDVPPQVIVAIAKYGAQFGFSKAWSDAPWEDWHHTYQIGHYSGPDPFNSSHDKEKDAYPVLKAGSKRHAAVKKAQKQLARHNLGITRPKVDGDFGATTEKAVKDFKFVHGLEDNATIDKKTWEKLKLNDALFPAELTAVNRVRLAQRNGIQPGQEDEYKRNIDYLQKRIDDFKSHTDTDKWWWKKYNRTKRFTIIKKTVNKNWR